MEKSDVKDMFEKFAWFDRCCFIGEMAEDLTEYFKNTEEYDNDPVFAEIMGNSVANNYRKLGSVTAVYQAYISDKNITDALVDLVYTTVYKEKDLSNSIP